MYGIHLKVVGVDARMFINAGEKYITIQEILNESRKKLRRGQGRGICDRRHTHYRAEWIFYLQ